MTRLVDRAAGTLKFRPTLRFEGPVRTLVGDNLAPDLLAVLGEALSNASRHAEARTVEVVLTAGDDGRAPVADNGRGLDASVHESGLRNMRERAERARRHVPGGVRPRRGHHPHVDGARGLTGRVSSPARPCPTPRPARARRPRADRGRLTRGTPRGGRAPSNHADGPAGRRGVRRP